jgi:hypothetical protein
MAPAPMGRAPSAQRFSGGTSLMRAECAAISAAV